MRIALTVNGRSHTVDVEPDTPLLYILRNDLDLHGPRFGCGLSQCGACTVLVQGRPVRSCVTPVSSVKPADQITTLDGLGTPEKPHPIQQAWIDAQAAQCGFCMNGHMMVAKSLLDRNPNPTDAQIRQALEPVLCRCGSYYRVIAAVKRAAELTRAAGTARG
jgi:aerobic-type carbon monoxide dehydrogenase small subunit (CoxS/CutS family)